MLFARRLAVTLSIPLLLLVLTDHVFLPGIPAEIAESVRGSRANFSVFALGIQPIVTAYWIVEVIAFLVPRWSRLRHGNPEGRAKLDAAVRVLVLVLAAIQAFGMALSLQAIGNDPMGAGFSISTPLVMVSLVGGVCVQFVAARLISTYGLMNGFVAILGANLLLGVGQDVMKGLEREALQGGSVSGSHGLNPLGLLVVIGATCAAVHGAGRAPEPPAKESTSGAPYRSARWLAVHPWIPVPSGSIQPYFLASSLLLLPVTFTNLGLPLGDVAQFLQRGDTAFTVLFVALGGGAMVLFARLLHRPAEMADLATRLGAAEGKKLERQGREALRRTLLPSCLFLVAIMLSHSWLGGATVAILTIVLMDLALALRLEQKAPDLVPVWEERRASAVPVLRAALAAEGIPTETRGMAFLSLWQIFAPYAPAQILVKEADAERATKTLRLLLLGEERPERGEPPPSEWHVPIEPWTLSRRTAALGACALAASVLTFVGSLPAHESATEPVPRAELEVVRVDDTIDPFATVHEDALPEGQGIGIYLENAPAGPGHNVQSHYVRVVLREAESTKAAIKRVQPWLSTIRLPRGARFGFEEVDDYDPDTKKATPVGVRTFVLIGEPVLRTSDVTEAVVSMDNADGLPPDYYLAVTLSQEAGKRFEAATREWIQRRIAIVVDGEINSAPVVKSAIGGGRISITMGQGDPEKQLRAAKRLARALGGR
jgi:preprotein translocase subunit SecY